MSPKATALLEAHRQHLLAQFTPEHMNATLSREVNAFFDWSQTQPINQVVKLETIQSVAQRYVLAQPVSSGLTQQILHIIKRPLTAH